MRVCCDRTELMFDYWCGDKEDGKLNWAERAQKSARGS